MRGLFLSVAVLSPIFHGCSSSILRSEGDRALPADPVILGSTTKTELEARFGKCLLFESDRDGTTETYHPISGERLTVYRDQQGSVRLAECGGRTIFERAKYDPEL